MLLFTIKRACNISMAAEKQLSRMLRQAQHDNALDWYIYSKKAAVWLIRTS